MAQHPEPRIDCFIICDASSRGAVGNIEQALRTRGYSVVIHPAEEDGPAVRGAIQRTMDVSNAIMVTLSPAALQCTAVTFTYSRALRHHKLLIPLLTESVALPKALEAIQYVDCSGPSDESLRKILASLPPALAGPAGLIYTAASRQARANRRAALLAAVVGVVVVASLLVVVLGHVGLGARGSAAASPDSLLYDAATDNHVYALDLATGAVRWTYAVGSPAQVVGLTPNGSLLIRGMDGTLHLVNASDGTPNLKITGYTASGTPAISGGIIFVPTMEGSSCSLYALRASDGGIVWKYAAARCIQSAPAVANGLVVVGTMDGNLHALSASDGHTVWDVPGPSVAPVIVNGIVYASADSFGSRSLYALNLTDGTIRWKHKLPYGAFGITVANGALYANATDGMYALDASAGTLLWSFVPANGFPVNDAPVVSGGLVLFGCSDNTFYALSARDGSAQWKFTVGRDNTASPVTVRGVVYFASNDGYVYALHLADGTVVWKAKIDPDANGGNQQLVIGP